MARDDNDGYGSLQSRGAVELTLNRPDVRNAFNEQVIAELTAWAAQRRRADPARCAWSCSRAPARCSARAPT